MKKRVSETYDKERIEIEEGIVASVLGTDPDRPLQHGVFTHENHRVATQTLANTLQLGGSDVVGRHNKDLVVLVQQLAQLGVVCDLLLGF